MATRILVTGQVQGVGYRYAFARTAEELGLAGWVRNRRDGTVEACVDGAVPQVDRIVAWARVGPPAAHVEQVWTETTATDIMPAGFHIGATV